MLKFIKKCLGLGEPTATRDEQEPEDLGFDIEQFIYLKIPGNIGPIDRGTLYEDKIDPLLEAQDVGFVAGGGSGLSDPLPDGRRVVEYCGIDIETSDRDRALVCLRDALPSLHISEQTELHYTADGVKLLDRYSDGQWQVGLCRDFLHPGFLI